MPELDKGVKNELRLPGVQTPYFFVFEYFQKRLVGIVY